MSYRFHDPRLLPPPSAVHRPIYPLPAPTYPLAQIETDAAALARERGMTVGKVLLIVVVIAALYVLFRKLNEGKSAPPPVRNPVSRASTQLLAKKLYERLEARGSTNPDMMRSLAMYAKPAKR